METESKLTVAIATILDAFSGKESGIKYANYNEAIGDIHCSFLEITNAFKEVKRLKEVTESRVVRADYHEVQLKLLSLLEYTETLATEALTLRSKVVAFQEDEQLHDSEHTQMVIKYGDSI